MSGALISFALYDELVPELGSGGCQRSKNSFEVGTPVQNVFSWALFVFDTSRLLSIL